MIIYLKDNNWTPDKCIICLKPIFKRPSKMLRLHRFLNIPDYNYCENEECIDMVRAMEFDGSFERILNLIQRNTGAKRK